MRPDSSHKWTAKVATKGTGKDGYIGDYAVKVDNTTLIVDSDDFTKLAPGDYEFEIWEERAGHRGRRCGC